MLLDKIEQVIRLIRSKGVGVWFVSQNPSDIPDNVLGQLGNRVQHALRAFTPKDQKAVKAAAQTMRVNPAFDTETAIQALGTGEALISFLDAKGSPTVVERAMVIAPCSRMGPVTDDERNGLINHSRCTESMKTRWIANRRSRCCIKGCRRLPNRRMRLPQREICCRGRRHSRRAERYSVRQHRATRRQTRWRGSDHGKSATRQITNQIVRGMLGSLLGGRRR